jgi:3-phosphoshikimate 1-carboxyvinyltransferase
VTGFAVSPLVTPMLVDRIDQLPDSLRIPTLHEARPVHAHHIVKVMPPGSKSLTNRAILLAALAQGTSTLHRPLTDADDARQMLRAVTQLGASVVEREDLLEITGVGGRWAPKETAGGELVLNLNNAGTAVRFLAGAALLSPVPIVIDGNARMRQRPIGELAEMLRTLGCTVEFPSGNGQCPPMRIVPPADLASCPTNITVGSTLSSQFISALLQAAPFLPKGLTLKLTEPATSASYVQMTLGLLVRLGVESRSSSDGQVIRIGGTSEAGVLPAFTYHVEPDASGATYFWAAAAMCGIPNLRCRVVGLDDQSLQGDAMFPQLLRRMGAGVSLHQAGEASFIEVDSAAAVSPVLADMSDMPDAAMTLASVACFAHGTSIIRGLRTLRVKETDRILAMQEQLAKIGVVVATPVAGDSDAITITPPLHGIDCSDHAPQVRFDTYDDHRMAMSLALIGLRRPNTWINHPACVAKTYAGFWRDFAKLYAGD